MEEKNEKKRKNSNFHFSINNNHCNYSIFYDESKKYA